MAALSQTAGNVLRVSGSQQTVTAGGTITAGMPVYKDTADSDKHKAARANSLTTSAVAGIALTGSSNNQPLAIQTAGVINLGATLAIGETYCLSDAVAGQIVPIGDLGSSDITVILGIAATTANLNQTIQTAGVAKA